jgi:hypothetical protein
VADDRFQSPQQGKFLCLHIAASNPVGTASDNAKEPIKMVGFFVV